MLLFTGTSNVHDFEAPSVVTEQPDEVEASTAQPHEKEQSDEKEEVTPEQFVKKCDAIEHDFKAPSVVTEQPDEFEASTVVLF